MKSRRVIVAGVGPIPPHEADRLYAPGLRLWMFADEIEKRGHHVILCEAMFGGRDEGLGTLDREFEGRRIDHVILPLEPRAACDRIRSIASTHRVEAAVSSTDVMNCALALAKLPVPIWLDFNGHPMTERQMLAKVNENDETIIDQWIMLLPSLLGGDRFSTCAAPQRAALIGELGACGRLNRLTTGIDLVRVVYPLLVRSGLKGSKGAIRGKLTGEDDVVVLYTGGYNTWMDEATLFKALENAMDRNPKIQFVTTGGAIEGHNEKTFENFKAAVESSRFKDRFHFRGWVRTDELADYYLEADLVVNVDAPSYEGFLGWRYRVMEWVGAGIPLVTTTVSEVAADLADRDLAASFECGDWRRLADHLVSFASDPEPVRIRARRAQEYMIKKYSREMLDPLLDWIDEPKPAPDLPPPDERPKIDSLVHPENSLSAYRAEMVRNFGTLSETGGRKERDGFGALVRKLFERA